MRRIGLAISALVLLSLAQVLFGASATADTDNAPALAILDDGSPAISDGDNGWVVELSATNLTQGELNLTVTPAASGPSGCTATPKPATLPPAADTKFEVDLAAPCAVADGFTFTLSVSSGDLTQPFTVNATKTAEAAEEWGSLQVFVVALSILIVVGIVASVGVIIKRDPEGGYLGKLPYLDASWSFSDSWLTNITAAAGLLTGVVGSSEVVKALLGVDGDNDLRMATVGAAISLALLALTPLVLGIFQPKTGEITIIGLFLAAAVSVAAAVSEVWVMGRTAESLDVPWLADHSMTLAVVVIVLVLVYSVIAMRSTVSSGLTKPTVAESEALQAARIVARAIESARNHISARDPALTPEHQAQLIEALGEAESHAQDLISSSTRPIVRRRSALL